MKINKNDERLDKDYEELKNIMKNMGWKIIGKDSYFNGESVVNFVKNGSIITLTLDTYPDEEFLKSLNDNS